MARRADFGERRCIYTYTLTPSQHSKLVEIKGDLSLGNFLIKKFKLGE
jgi:hypothetical protein